MIRKFGIVPNEQISFQEEEQCSWDPFRKCDEGGDDNSVEFCRFRLD